MFSAHVQWGWANLLPGDVWALHGQADQYCISGLPGLFLFPVSDCICDVINFEIFRQFWTLYVLISNGNPYFVSRALFVPSCWLCSLPIMLNKVDKIGKKPPYCWGLYIPPGRSSVQMEALLDTAGQTKRAWCIRWASDWNSNCWGWGWTGVIKKCQDRSDKKVTKGISHQNFLD